jgi:hypothetical protein
MNTEVDIKTVPDDYLGDGVYVHDDGYHIILDLRAQDSTTRIALEPAVMSALLRYNERVMDLRSMVWWWGYRHISGTFHAKRWFSEMDITEASRRLMSPLL